MSRSHLIICCSMQFREEAVGIQQMLKKLGIHSIIPVPEDQEKATLSKEAFRAFVRLVSLSYLKKIGRNQRKTKAILIINPPKKGISGYIGPNTFAEAANAFATNKPIFILHDLAPETGLPPEHRHIMGFAELLKIWGAQCLKRNLKPLTHLFNNSCASRRRAPRHKRKRGYR